MTTTVLDDLKRLYNRAWWALLLRALLAIAVGVFIFARPLDSVAAFALVIAWWALFSGLVNIVHAIQLKPVMQHWWVLLLSGLIGVGFGIAALVYYPTLSLSFAVVWAAWWLMFTGILGIYAALQERTLGHSPIHVPPSATRVPAVRKCASGSSSNATNGARSVDGSPACPNAEWPRS